jgi:hypothetical protein
MLGYQVLLDSKGDRSRRHRPNLVDGKAIRFCHQYIEERFVNTTLCLPASLGQAMSFNGTFGSLLSLFYIEGSGCFPVGRILRD